MPDQEVVVAKVSHFDIFTQSEYLMIIRLLVAANRVGMTTARALMIPESFSRVTVTMV